MLRGANGREYLLEEEQRGEEVGSWGTAVVERQKPSARRAANQPASGQPARREYNLEEARGEEVGFAVWGKDQPILLRNSRSDQCPAAAPAISHSRILHAFAVLLCSWQILIIDGLWQLWFLIPSLAPSPRCLLPCCFRSGHCRQGRRDSGGHQRGSNFVPRD